MTKHDKKYTCPDCGGEGDILTTKVEETDNGYGLRKIESYTHADHCFRCHGTGEIDEDTDDD
jgi:DnaJ-class molecular chaperone